MLSETRDALLYAQLQEGLRYDLMKAQAVSGALNYQALCVAAKSEGRRLDELQKRKCYRSPHHVLAECGNRAFEPAFAGLHFGPQPAFAFLHFGP